MKLPTAEFTYNKQVKGAGKIIDFERKGNVVRFYLGREDDNQYWGDDWNDAPYEHNAGRVYNEYVIGTADVVFPFDWEVLEPRDGQCNSGWSKEDMQKRYVPCIVAVPPTAAVDTWWLGDFQKMLGVSDTKKIYFGDTAFDFMDGGKKDGI